MSKTLENLKTAFSGESQANRKYLAFAAKAEKDGFPIVAKLFRAAADAETVHAMGHFQNMDGVQSTAENLKAAIEGETYETNEMYPPMVETAKEEGHKALRMFTYAMKAERVHADLYTKALEAVKEGKDLPEMEIWYCPSCGNIEFGPEIPEKCKICGAAREKFIKV